VSIAAISDLKMRGVSPARKASPALVPRMLPRIGTQCGVWVGGGPRRIVGSGIEPDGFGSRVESGCVKEIECPRRRKGRGFGGQAQMGENLANRGEIGSIGWWLLRVRRE